MEDFWSFLLFVAAITFPVIAALAVRWMSKYSIPKHAVFVILSSAIVYGAVTMLSMLGLLVVGINKFFGAALEYQGHHELFQATVYVSQYGWMLSLPVMLILSILVPVRLAQKWSAIVAVWG